MTQPSGNNRRIIILAIVAAVIAVCFIFYKAYKANFLKNKFPALVENKTNRLYQIAYDSISVDEIGGNVSIKNLYLKPDTALQLQMLHNGDTNAAKMLLDIYIPELKVVSFKTAKALLANQMECRQIVLLNPQVRMYIFPGQGKQKDISLQKQELYKQILGNFKKIHADSIAIINATVTAVDFFTKEIKFQTLQTNVGLHEVAIDSLSNQDTSRTLFCKEIKLNSNKIYLGEKNKSAEITNAAFDTRSQMLSLGRFSYDAFKNDGFFKSDAQGISFKGISWSGPVENSALLIGDATIEKAEVEILPQEKSEQSSLKKNTKPILSGWLKDIAVKSLSVKSATFITRNSKSDKNPISISNNALMVNNLHIDNTTVFDNKLFSKAGEIKLTNAAISIKSGDGFYEYRFSGIQINTLRKTLGAKSLSIIPQYNEAEFARRKRVQSDRYDITFRDLLLKNLDINKLNEGGLFAGEASATNSSVKVFDDLNYPIDSVTKASDKQRFPHQMLCKLDMPVKINRFRLSNTYIEYKEREIISKNSGRVRFSNSDIVISNISNQNLKAGEKTTVTFSTNFMEKVRMKGSFTFALDDWKKGKFSVETETLNTVDATIFNELTQPMALAKIEKGTLGAIKFSMTADTTISNGTLMLPYENLKLSLLKKKENEYRKKGLLSLVANLVVKNKNEPGDKFRTAKVEVKRNIYRSFFNLIWLTIFKGLKETMVLKL